MQQFCYPVQVHIEDVDFASVVYHPNYLNFYQRARTEMFYALGFGLKWQLEQGFAFAVRKAELEYLLPARLHDELEVLTSIKRVKKTSIQLHQSIRLSDNPDVCLNKVNMKVGCVDTDVNISVIPEALMKELQSVCE